jgi:hypothetical protein
LEGAELSLKRGLVVPFRVELKLSELHFKAVLTHEHLENTI